MQSIGGRKLLALAVSSLAAIALLVVAGWMLLGGSDQPTASAVQIIPPPAADDGPKDGGAETAAGQSNADAAVASRAGAAAQPAPDAPAAGSPASSPADPPGDIAVYLTGAVVKPGVYAMRPGQRLADALELAGGPTGDAALHRINLAAYLADAAHYRIPAVGEAEAPAVASPPAAASPPSGAVAVAVAVAPVAGVNPPAAPASSSPAASCGTPIDINAATADCLQTLPGIGRVRAESIVAHRQQAGPFAAIEGITEVSGIGSGIYGQIAKLITAGPR